MITREPRAIAFEEVELREPGPHDVVVKAGYVGICRSDIELLDGDFDDWVSVDYPIVIGHEWSGEVVDVGSNVTNVSAGDIVVGECVAGHEQWFGLTFDGAGSESFVAPARLLHRVPNSLSLRRAALVEPFTVSYRAIQLASPCDAADVVAVLGGGMIGQCAQVVAHACGATTIVVEPSESRRTLATTMGADATIDPLSVDDVGTALREASGHAGATIVVEASGNALAMSSAFEIAAENGTIVNVGICPEPQIAAPLAQIQAKNLTIRGMTGSPGVWPRALRFLARHDIDLSPLVSHEFHFGEIEAALEAVRDTHHTLKVLLHP